MLLASAKPLDGGRSLAILRRKLLMLKRLCEEAGQSIYRGKRVLVERGYSDSRLGRYSSRRQRGEVLVEVL